MGYREIYDEYQTQYEKSNRVKFRALLDVFKEETGLNIDDFAPVFQIDTTDAAKEFYFLRWFLFNHCNKYIPYFYELLESFGYDMFSEIIHTMTIIGEETDTIVDPQVIEYSKINPYIDNVTVDQNKGGLVTIYSEDLGDFSFYPSRVYLRNNADALKAINDFETLRQCHQISWKIAPDIDKCELITSLLPSYFEGTHYHTVLRDDKGMAIDASNQAVYTEDTRDMLFKANDICTTKQEDLDSKLQLAIEAEDEASKEEDFPEAMLITLHEQSKVLK